MNRPFLHSLPLGCLAFTAMFAPGLQSAESASAEPSTLDVLVTEITRSNPELNFYEAEIDAAKAGLRSAGARADPEVAVGAGRKRVREASGILAGEGTTWSVSVTQTFEWPGRLGLRKSIANRQIELAELGLERFKTALASRARVLVYGVLVAQEKSSALQEVAQRYQALREVYFARDPAGITPLLETRVIEAQELSLKRRATVAGLAEQAAVVELNQLRGAAVDAPLAPVRAALTFNRPPSLSELLADARDKNFEFRMKRVEVEQQGLEVSLARNERYPGVSVSPYYSREKAGERETTFGVGFSVPLPLTNRNRGAVDGAEARRRQAETMLLVAQRDLERDVIMTFQTFEAKIAAMAQWRPDSMAQFRDAAALADRHYRLGAVPLATYVELQGAYLEAVEALLETKHEALEAGQKLQLLTGRDFNAIQLTR